MRFAQIVKIDIRELLAIVVAHAEASFLLFDRPWPPDLAAFRRASNKTGGEKSAPCELTAAVTAKPPYTKAMALIEHELQLMQPAPCVKICTP
jgi:hypothetical protein